MGKLFKFYTNDEFEAEIELTEEQEKFLYFILDWGFFSDSVRVEEERQYEEKNLGRSS